ncbi:MAG: 4-alpha-glucanotransferase, partial [Saprospiraceae bacterium]|nr:4-alpha-glucanotransferase [Saprospiraceae bacterium]
MKILFHLRYFTRFGENLYVVVDALHGSTLKSAEYPMSYLNDELWQAAAEWNDSQSELYYRYELRNQEGEIKEEWGRRRIDPAAVSAGVVEVFDYWNPPGAVENAFETQLFRVFDPITPVSPEKNKPGAPFTHLFKTRAPLLKSDEVLCLLGHGVVLRGWDTQAPLLLQRGDDGWSIRLDLSRESFPLGYKYGVWNIRTNKFLGFEDGPNRTLYTLPPATEAPSKIILHDGFARFPTHGWRGAGVAIPVFSLRSKKSWGIGEFTDLPLLVDWAKTTGLKLIQLLPINDTTATHTWVDSYPYSAISAFALHPVFLNVEQLAGKKHAAVLKPYVKKQKELNGLETVDYEAVVQLKWEIIRQLYELQKAGWLKDEAYHAYYESNKHWLEPYAAFCRLRDANGTADFSQWPSHGTYKPAEVEKLISPKSKTFDETAIHLFVQWHLHLQLKAATDYAHANGVAVKGDIPIGIYRNSCDAWVAPGLYNMDMQAGAPPDDFAVNGQNWGFPTYNWERMKADGFAWWRQRFHQMSLYFDAFRIDHILGFFRIWSIPMDAVEGILGHFVPAIPVTEQELREAGVGFDHDRLCKPYITEPIVTGLFGADANWVGEHCLLPRKDERFDLKPEFSTQRRVEQYFEKLPATEQNIRLRDGLYRLVANVVLLDPAPGGKGLHFRFGIEKTTSFQ